MGRLDAARLAGEARATAEPPGAATGWCASRSRRPRGSRGGQALIEFGLVYGLFLVALMAAIASAAWSVEVMGVVTAGEQGARLAVGAAGVGAGANQVDLSSVHEVIPRLRGTSFGTPIEQYTPPPGGPCHTVAQVSRGHGGGNSLEVCAFATPTSFGGAVPTTAELRAWQITVRISGCANLMVPMPFSFSDCQGGVPVDNITVMHPGVYQP